MTSLGGIFDLAQRQDEISRLEEQTAQPTFWDRQDEAQKALKQLTQLRQSVDPWLDLEKKIKDLDAYIELVSEEEDDSVYEAEIRTDLDAAKARMDGLELSTMLNEEHDSSDAIVEINSGAGGTESCDWVEMLLRMYLRWAERKGYSTEIIDSVEGDVAGLKNVTFTVRGMNAYGYIKAERGVHRLVRISPFDSNNRRHTSFASVDAVPEIAETDEIEINSDDLKVDTYRASSAGGQHVNKTDSAVRITHVPTGIIVSCQNERSQHQNREVAMKVLKAKLLEMERRESEAKLAELRGEKRAIEWGSQIRSYVFQPYQLVKDLRTDVETGNIIAVMDGEIDMFVDAYLRWRLSPETE